MRDLEMISVKQEVKRLAGEVENLRFQEQLLRTSFRVQKTELESKVSELVNYCMGSAGGGGSTQNSSQSSLSNI